MSRIVRLAVALLAFVAAMSAPVGRIADAAAVGFATHATSSSADTTRPEAQYAFAGSSTFGNHVVIVGTATDDRRVDRVRVSIKDSATGLWRQKGGGWGPQRAAWSAELSEAGEPFVTWTHRVTLPEGEYVLDVRAKDHAGNVGKKRPRRHFHVDSDVPDGALLVAAGDIARCDSNDDEATARLLDELFADRSGVVAALGDSVYESGTKQEFADCYDPTWGRHKSKTRPAVGNHEYHTTGAKPYYSYFGPRAGERGSGYYAFDHGAWRIIVLNSNCSAIGGCGPTSPQGRWLARELTRHPVTCSLATMHHPRFSSGGEHGDAPEVETLWQQLHDAGVDVVLAGHDHDYERLARLDPSGHRDPDHGIRSFVVGTGGTGLRPMGPLRPHSKVAIDDRHGVLALELGDGVYTYTFITTPDSDAADSGSGKCA